MDAENLNIDEITEARRKAIAESLEVIDVKQLQKLAESMFPFPDHPWMIKLSELMSGNPYGTFHYATTHDHLQVIYSSEKDKGMWFQANGGKGILSPGSLKIMREIVGKG